MKKSEPTSPGERLKQARIMTGLSRNKFMKASSLSESSLRSWESGINPIRPSVAYNLSIILEKLGIICTPEWILDGNGECPKLKNTHEESSQTGLAEIGLQREICAFNMGNENTVVKIVPDDSMLPFFKKNDYVGGHEFKKPGTLELYSNKICIVEMSDGETLIRKILIDKKNNVASLICTNENLINSTIYYQSSVKIKKISEIIWHRRV